MTTKSIVLWIATGTAMILGFNRFYGFLSSTEYYWTFRSLATNKINFDKSIVGFLVVLSIPVIAGIILVRTAKKPIIGIATASGFLATLLQSWPILFFPKLREQLVQDSLKDKPLKLFIIQILYIMAYTILCRIGALIASKKMPRKKEDHKEKIDYVMYNILIGLVVCLIWQVLLTLWQ